MYEANFEYIIKAPFSFTYHPSCGEINEEIECIEGKDHRGYRVFEVEDTSCFYKIRVSKELVLSNYVELIIESNNGNFLWVDADDIIERKQLP